MSPPPAPAPAGAPAADPPKKETKSFVQKLLGILGAVLAVAIFLLVLDPLLGLGFTAGGGVIHTIANGFRLLGQGFGNLRDAFMSFIANFAAIGVQIFIVIAAAILIGLAIMELFKWARSKAN